MTGKSSQRMWHLNIEMKGVKEEARQLSGKVVQADGTASQKPWGRSAWQVQQLLSHGGQWGSSRVSERVSSRIKSAWIIREGLENHWKGFWLLLGVRWEDKGAFWVEHWRDLTCFNGITLDAMLRVHSRRQGRQQRPRTESSGPRW